MDDLKNILSNLPVDVLVFGEVLVDCFPDGRRVLGGAPFNVAWALRGFGLHPLLISAVGDDAEGRALRERMTAWGMDLSVLQTHPKLGTGVVEVSLKDGEPSYDISAPRAWDAIEYPGPMTGAILYHGVLALRAETSRDTFKALCEGTKAGRFFDVNLRPPHTPIARVKELLPGAAWVKVNLNELAQLLEIKNLTLESADVAMDALLEAFNIGNLLLTAGGDGAKIRGACGEAFLSPAPAAPAMVDTVGAGDAFSSVTLRGILRGDDPGILIRDAAAFAADVCGLRGATTDDPAFYVL